MGWSGLIHGDLKIEENFFKLKENLGKVVTKEFLHSFLLYKKPRIWNFPRDFTTVTEA